VTTDTQTVEHSYAEAGMACSVVNLAIKFMIAISLVFDRL